MQNKDIFIGVDVSKKTLDIALHGTRQHLRISNTAEGLKQFCAWLKKLDITLANCWVVLEYTGGYEYRLLQFLQDRHIRFSRLSGLEIKKSMGIQRGKSDKTDAHRIATYGHEKKDKLRESRPVSPLITSLRQLLTQRAAFIADREAHEHRLEELRSMMPFKKADPLLAHYRKAVAFATTMTKKVETAIAKLVASDAALSRNFTLLTSIPGIGQVNAWMTIAYTENFESFATARKYGAYCGVVPYEYTSGTSIRGKSRVSPLANQILKANLTMAARSAVNWDPELKAYYQRRKEMGKHHMAILNEVKFKLILRMFAVVNKGEVYVKNYTLAA